MVSFRVALALLREIILDTLMAVMDRTSSSSTHTSLSPTFSLSATTLDSLMAKTHGAPSSGVSMTTPNFPAGAYTSMTSSLT
eukprot:CAMPEP_0198294566 /NCGR_PEP_ID=MMETSP1449-20131203/23060_1 /TAXON_ID=420275 /ORGANISM="Attheya septentrionalis, Strain CCMP2084" /LENGTH=81 /DNA_ID=CAMNT_0043994551 /DNA_START=176 /DNA_END=421 /DNA_ORIENTATION=-